MFGAAVLGGITALVLTAFVLALLHSSIIFSSCTTTTSSPPVCTPQSWKWVLSGAGVVGAAVGGIGTFLVIRHRARSHDRAAPPVGQLSDCVSRQRLDSWV